MKLTEHFTLEELTRSEMAERLKIANSPNPTETDHLTFLAKNILEKLRTRANRPLAITSGFRSRELNKAVGGAATSYHIHGMAADIRTLDYNETVKLATFAKELPFLDLAIIEVVNGSHWLHVQYSYKPRHKVIEIIKP